jgi:hypothetical protein
MEGAIDFRSMERTRVLACQRSIKTWPTNTGSKLKVGLIRAAARRSRAEHANTLSSDAETISATGAAAVQFTNESPGLSEPQKDRVAEVIAVLDKMNERERNLVKALVSEPFADWPEMPARLPEGTQPDDVVRASFYYSIEIEEAQRRRNRRFQMITIIGGALGFLATWALQLYTLWQMRP